MVCPYGMKKCFLKITEIMGNFDKNAIVKRLHLSGGREIEKIDYSDAEQMFGGSVAEELIFEECISQHKEMAELNTYSVNTLRIFTIADAQGKVRILNCIVRMGVSTSCVDNACAGGIFAAVDRETGIICSKARGYNLARENYIFTPMTHKQLLGQEIPSWEAVCKLGVDVGKELFSDGKKYIASDIAILSDGTPELIEVNFFGDSRIRQLEYGVPVEKWKEMKRYFNDERKN